MPAAKFEIVRKCKVCGELFKAKTIESWYCSPRCSKIAWKRNKDEELRMQKLDEVVKKIPKSKDYITVPEAYALFGISKETLYRLIRKGVISSVNVGERQIRLSKEELLKLYPLRKKALAKPKPIAKLYSLEPKDCCMQPCNSPEEQTFTRSAKCLAIQMSELRRCMQRWLMRKKKRLPRRLSLIYRIVDYNFIF